MRLFYLCSGLGVLFVFYVLFFQREDLSRCEVAVLKADGFNITLDVASDEIKRRLGLMFRRELPKDRGMLFVFDKEDEQAFWMKNTYIPLDIIFVSDDMRITKIFTDIRASYEGESEETIPRVYGRGRYVIEINASMSVKLRLREGSKISLRCLKKKV